MDKLPTPASCWLPDPLDLFSSWASLITIPVSFPGFLHGPRFPDLKVKFQGIKRVLPWEKLGSFRKPCYFSLLREVVSHPFLWFWLYAWPSYELCDFRDPTGQEKGKNITQHPARKKLCIIRRLPV